MNLEIIVRKRLTKIMLINEQQFKKSINKQDVLLYCSICYIIPLYNHWFGLFALCNSYAVCVMINLASCNIFYHLIHYAVNGTFSICNYHSHLLRSHCLNEIYNDMIVIRLLTMMKCTFEIKSTFIQGTCMCHYMKNHRLKYLSLK